LPPSALIRRRTFLARDEDRANPGRKLKKQKELGAGVDEMPPLSGFPDFCTLSNQIPVVKE
jgi:hypothetical protein